MGHLPMIVRKMKRKKYRMKHRVYRIKKAKNRRKCPKCGALSRNFEYSYDTKNKEYIVLCTGCGTEIK